MEEEEFQLLTVPALIKLCFGYSAFLRLTCTVQNYDYKKIQDPVLYIQNLLRSSPEVIGIIPLKSIFPAYRKTKNLKELLAPSKFSSNTVRNQNSEEAKECFKCNKKRCDLCQHYLIQDTKFQSFASNRIYRINQQVSCTSKNVIYLASCNLCRKKYVGSTSTEFKVRFRNHKLAIHCSHHDIHQISFTII